MSAVGCSASECVGGAVMMDELLQNIQDSTDEIASTIRLAIWVQIMSGNTLEDENDTD